MPKCEKENKYSSQDGGVSWQETMVGPSPCLPQGVENKSSHGTGKNAFKCL
jgi:hypothetical protein